MMQTYKIAHGIDKVDKDQLDMTQQADLSSQVVHIKSAFECQMQQLRQ